MTSTNSSVKELVVTVFATAATAVVECWAPIFWKTKTSL